MIKGSSNLILSVPTSTKFSFPVIGSIFNKSFKKVSNGGISLCLNNLLLNLPRKLVYNYYVHPNFQLKLVDRAEVIYDQQKKSC